MNTPTPRTDKLSVSLLRKTFLTSYVAMKEHACTLERELTHAREINAGSEANVAFLREELERERAEREVQRLKSDGAASAFVNMSCRASRAETDRNNLRADKARLDWLEKARPIAWALGSEECGEYWILTDTGEKHPEEAEEFATLRAAIDAAMKEGTK